MEGLSSPSVKAELLPMWFCRPGERKRAAGGELRKELDTIARLGRVNANDGKNLGNEFFF